jgi:RND family efflux transporter MFP subunit
VEGGKVKRIHTLSVGAASLPRFIALVVATGIWLLQISCQREQQSVPQAGTPVRVQTVEIQPQRTPDIHEIMGTVRPKVSATISAKLMAAIEKIYVKAGNAMSEGQQLAQLDDRELRAEFERAKADYDRFNALLEKQAVTRAEFDAVQSRYRVAEAALSYANITAPFDGIVAEKLCDVGDLTSPGKPLFVVEKPTEFRLETQVPERLAGAATVGKRLDVTVDATGEKCTGAIGEVVPTADPTTRSFLVKIDLQCKAPLRSGMFGRALLPVGERHALFAPKNAVHERGQLTFVFVVGDGRAHMRLVKTGKGSADSVEVLSGLRPGERIAVSAEGELEDGYRVEER